MAAAETTGQMANLHLDEPSGEMVRYIFMIECYSHWAKYTISKSELKKRQKQRHNDEKKREKAAVAPPRTEKHTSVEEEENDLTPNVGCFECVSQEVCPTNSS